MLSLGLVAEIASVCFCVERGGLAPQLTSHHGERERDVRGRAEDLEEGYEVIEVQRLETDLEKTPGTVTSRTGEAIVKDNCKPESLPFIEFRHLKRV